MAVAGLAVGASALAETQPQGTKSDRLRFGIIGCEGKGSACSNCLHETASGECGDSERNVLSAVLCGEDTTPYLVWCPRLHHGHRCDVSESATGTRKSDA